MTLEPSIIKESLLVDAQCQVGPVEMKKFIKLDKFWVKNQDSRDMIPFNDTKGVKGVWGTGGRRCGLVCEVTHRAR